MRPSNRGRAPSASAGGWALSCLETYKRPYVKPNTYAGTYLAPVQNHLIPAFGEMKIGDIKPVHIQRYINQASAKYAPETVKKDYNCLKLIFDTAVDNQLCLKSPLTRSPRYETRKDKHAFTQAQYDIAYAAAKEYGGLSLMLMLETGLSRSELRHTRATLWIAQGIDPYMVARLLGHSDLKMLTKIYDHTSTETLRKALLETRPDTNTEEKP